MKPRTLQEWRNRRDFDGVIILVPEFDVVLPLWPQSDKVETLIPLWLLEKLKNWQDDFQSNFNSDLKWRSDKAKVRWTRTAAALETELQVALLGKAEFFVDLWPIRNSDNNRPLQEYRKRRQDELKEFMREGNWVAYAPLSGKRNHNHKDEPGHS